MTKTLFDKVWDQHVVTELDDGSTLLYIDRHLVHEVTSPQAFEGLRLSGRQVRCPERTIATVDHDVPTENQTVITDPIARKQIAELEKNVREFGIEYYGIGSERQGIVHVIGPELGLTLPGMTIVCGDSHTATHGAFGALAFGIGTSEVEHVLATQCLVQGSKPHNFLVKLEGKLASNVTSKDIILALIGLIGTAGGTGSVFEYAGSAIAGLSMEQRMTICNMSIEAGARAGMIAPDQVTFDYIKSGDRPFAPKGLDFDQALSRWGELVSDPDAVFDKQLSIDVSALAPQVTWGTNPAMVCAINEVIPEPNQYPHVAPSSVTKALEYMGLKSGMKLTDIPLDYVFIGSCTNGRIEDLRAAAAILAGKKVHSSVTTLVVPGSQRVKRQAEAEGLDRIFKDAGCSWRDPGCSMCLAMNPDRIPAGKHCASTSNRNFEGRQGKGARTHLVSPVMAAAAAVHGHFVDVRELN